MGRRFLRAAVRAARRRRRLRPQDGGLQIARQVRQHIGMVYQYSALLSSRNVRDNVALPLEEVTDKSREEIDKIRIESSHTISIDTFVPRTEIDDRYLDSPYYITSRLQTRSDRRHLPSSAMRSATREWSL